MSYQDRLDNGEEYVNFFNILPRDGMYRDYQVTSIPLRVIRGSNAVDVSPDISYSKVHLSDRSESLTRHVGDADTFKIKVVISKDDVVDGHVYKELYNTLPDGLINMTGMSDSEFEAWKKQYTSTPYDVLDYHGNLPIITILDYWIREGIIFDVVTDAIDIPNGSYSITANPSRIQENKTYTIWELEFTKYTTPTRMYTRYDNSITNQAIKDYEKSKKKKASKAKTTSAKTKTKQSTSVRSKLKKCTICKIKYSKSSKNTCICTYYMQYELARMKFYPRNLAIDGWFGPETLKAVKKFQKKYKTKYKLTVNGKVDKKTLNAICSV